MRIVGSGSFMIFAVLFCACSKPVASSSSAPQTATTASSGVAPVKLPARPAAASFDAGESVTIKGAAALGCEAKAVGDWIRLSCRGLSFFAGLPWRATVHSDHDARSLHKKEKLGDVSVTWRHAAGTDMRASFVWYPYMFRFRAHWPEAVAKRPQIAGEFVGAPDKTAAALIKATCACPPRLAPKLLLKSYQCESPSIDADSFDAWNPACSRHMLGKPNCQDMNESLTSEPSHFKVCAKDELLSGFASMRTCQRTCDAATPCPAGFACKPSEVLGKDDKLGPGPTACFLTDAARAAYIQSLAGFLPAPK